MTAINHCKRGLPTDVLRQLAGQLQREVDHLCGLSLSQVGMGFKAAVLELHCAKIIQARRGIAIQILFSDLHSLEVLYLEEREKLVRQCACSRQQQEHDQTSRNRSGNPGAV